MTRINLSGAKDYNGPSAPRSQLAPFQGFTYGDITSIEESVSGRGNVTMDMTIALREPGAEGINVRKVQAVSGEMGGKRAGTPNIVGLYDIYFSAFSGAVDEDEAMKLVGQMEGQELDTADVIMELKGKRVWFKIKASEATNRTTGEKYLVSDVDAFVSKQTFETNAEGGAHHWKNPDAPSNEPAGVGNGVHTGGTAGPARAAGRI